MYIYYCFFVVLVFIKLINIEFLLKIFEFLLFFFYINLNYNLNIRFLSFLCFVYCLGFKEFVV